MTIPNKKLSYVAFFVADRIDVTAYRKSSVDKPLLAGARSLYYQLGSTKFMYILNYGVVVFSDFGEEEIKNYLTEIKPFSTHPRQEPIEDRLATHVTESANLIELGFDQLTLGKFDHEINRMVMLHLAQSVALDHYNAMSQGILSELKAYTSYMEINGKVKLGHKQALKFIGKSLNAKNAIAENLYILDSPETAWENEYLDHLHNTLAKHFELIQRYREIDNTLKIIEDNLTIYITYNHHRESSRLEWIIIILIVIEVLDTFISKMM